jgi:hypothetical protein
MAVSDVPKFALASYDSYPCKLRNPTPLVLETRLDISKAECTFRLDAALGPPVLGFACCNNLPSSTSNTK